MKKSFFILFFFFAAIQELPAQLNEDGIIFRFSGAPRLVAELIGVGQVTSVVLANPTPFFMRASILGESFDIDPSDIIFDYWRVGFYYSQMPVEIKVFSDESREHLIGLAGDVLRIEKGRPTNRLDVNDIYFLDESYRPRNSSSDDPVLDPKKVRKVNIPTMQSELSTVVDFVNLTSSEITVTEVGPMGSNLVRYEVYPSTYTEKGFVKSRKKKIAPFDFGSFEVHISTYGQYDQSAMYWVGNGNNPTIVNIGPNPNWGPQAHRFVIK